MAVFNQIGGISTSSIGNIVKGPLARLEGAKNGATILQYPEDLTNDPSRMHWVQFTMYKTLPKDFLGNSQNNFTAVDITDMQTGAANEAAAAGTVSGRIASAVSGAFGGATGGASSLRDERGPGLIQALVNLYMPDTLNATYDNSYDKLELMEATRGLNRLAEAGGVVAENMAKIGGLSNLKNSPATRAMGYEVIGRVADAKLGTKVTNLAARAAGVAINPQLQLIYQGVDYRRFQMEFIMTPKTQQESDQVSSIVNAFVYAAHPEVDSATKGLYFIPPYEFEIQFRMAKSGPASGLLSQLQKAGNSLVSGFPLGNAVAGLLGGGATSKGEVNKRLFKFKRCVLESINVDHAPNGWTAHSGGAPVQTRLTLNFKEIYILEKSAMNTGEAW